jgi:hypothetical protein
MPRPTSPDVSTHFRPGQIGWGWTFADAAVNATPNPKFEARSKEDRRAVLLPRHAHPPFRPPRALRPSTLQRSNAPTLQRSNAPTLQRSNAPTLQRFNASTLQRSNAPTLQRFNASTLQRIPMGRGRRTAPGCCSDASRPMSPGFQTYI